MATIKRIGTIAAAAALCLAIVTPAMAASDITVGDFVQRLAKAKGLAGTDARVANDALRGVGIRLPSELNFANRLTEGDVAVISRVAGLTVRTSNPLNDFSSQQTDLFFASFRDDLIGGGDDNAPRSHTNPGAGGGPGNGQSGPPFDPFTKGKHGKGKGKGVFTPTDPE